MARRITIIQGHPQPGGGRLCHALADAYASAALEAGHDVKRIDISSLHFPLLRSQAEFQTGAVPPDLEAAQQAILWADHLVVLYPLWLGTMPALLKAFFEQTLRPGFAIDEPSKGFPSPRLKGRSARIVVTMGMPALAYRWFFLAHGLKNLKRNILGLCGIRPVRTTLFGMVEDMGERRYARLIAKMRRLGMQGR